MGGGLATERLFLDTAHRHAVVLQSDVHMQTQKYRYNIHIELNHMTSNAK